MKWEFEKPLLFINYRTPKKCDGYGDKLRDHGFGCVSLKPHTPTASLSRKADYRRPIITRGNQEKLGCPHFTEFDSCTYSFRPKARGSMKCLSIVAIIKRHDKLECNSYCDLKELNEQHDIDKINNEIHDRIEWFISGAAMLGANGVLVSVSHSVFSM